MDSQHGEDEPRPRVLLVAPRYRYGMDAGGLSTNPQEWGAWHRRRDSAGLCGELGCQLARPTRSPQVRPLCRPAGSARLHPESGWVAAATWDSNIRGQSGAASDRDVAGADLRARLPAIFVRIPATTVCPRRAARVAHRV